MGLFCVGPWWNTATSRSNQPSRTAVREWGAAVAEQQFLCNQREGKVGAGITGGNLDS